jgi:hypothetical protein
MILTIVPSWFVEVPLDVSGCVGGHLRAQVWWPLNSRSRDDVDAME